MEQKRDIEMGVYYTLDENNEPQQTTDIHEWAKWLEEYPEARRVEYTTGVAGKFTVSTVFLALDYGFDGSPAFFETMTFEEKEKEIEMMGKKRKYQPEYSGEVAAFRRYANFEEAKKGHEEIVSKLERVHGNKDVFEGNEGTVESDQ